MADEPTESGPKQNAADDQPLPQRVIDEAERLTRLAREAVDDGATAAYRTDRDALLTEHEYDARVRDDDVLVLHPAEWVAEGQIRVERVEDVDRGVEVPLSGPGHGDDWETIEAHNRELAETVADSHGEPHGSTAHALADFAGNHYAKPIEDLSAAELREFCEEYLPRNAWPSDEQRDSLTESIGAVFAAADARVPGSGPRTDD